MLAFQKEKSAVILMGVLSAKSKIYTKSFGRKNLCCFTQILPLKSFAIYVDFVLNPC